MKITFDVLESYTYVEVTVVPPGRTPQIAVGTRFDALAQTNRNNSCFAGYIHVSLGVLALQKPVCRQTEIRV